MNFMTVCFVFEIPPLSIYFDRYDMRLLLEKGYRIIVYDLSPILHPIAYNQRKAGLLEEFYDIPMYHIHTKRELKELLRRQTGTFFLSTLPVYSASYPLLKEISKYSYGFACNVDYVPPVPMNQRVQNTNFWTKWSWNRFKEAIFARLPRKYMPVKKANIIITYTNERLKEKLNNTLWNRNTQVMLTNTLDYNECLRTKKRHDRIIEEEYCLFIDQYLPLHPDGKEAGIYIDADRYYHEIMTFLNYVKEVTGKKVVIAGHPRGNYELYPQYFGDFEVRQWCTCELVKDAVFVMSHASISLSFVAIFQKPLLLLATNEMVKIENIKNALVAAGLSTQHEIINISQISNKEEVYSIIKEEIGRDRSNYTEQRRYYCLEEKHENSELQFGEVLVKAMLQI